MSLLHTILPGWTIEMYTINQQIEFAIYEANIMYEKAKKLNDRNGMREACLCLMTSYIATLRYEEGIQALEEAFQLMSPQDSPMDKISLLSKAILVYSQHFPALSDLPLASLCRISPFAKRLQEIPGISG